jgi:ring-1,2-phenylacetyl-CoA epoxidase subunit PaaD
VHPGDAVTTTVAVTPEAVRAALDTVPDPEMPSVSVAELGMVVDVRVHGRRVEVDLVATFSGCPATAVIREDVTAAVRTMHGVDDVAVRFVTSVVWDPERISGAGCAKLRAFGIAPPGSGQQLVQLGTVACPVCGSRNTSVDSPFGPTPCRSTHYCHACRNPFEAIKP